MEPAFQLPTGLVNVLEDKRTLAPLQSRFVMTEMIKDLRVLSHISDTKSPNDMEKVYFSAAIFNTQYKLTTFTANNAFVELRLYDLEEPRIFSSLFCRNATSLSLCLYINMVLRKLPLRAALHSTMAMHVKADLEKTGSQLLLTWAPNLELLLWILSIGAIATNGRVERAYFIDCLELTVMKMRLMDQESFVKVLHLTVWSEGLCSLQSEILWTDISLSSVLSQGCIDLPNP